MVAASKVSAKKARANRRNAKKSTGPKTAEGKKIASQNATSHGIYCRHVVLDGEDQQRFDLLRNAYIHSLRPQDELELSFVDRVVQDQWKLNRLQAAEQRLYDFRRREHQSLLERRRAGELGAPPLMEKRWERVDNVLDPMAEPDFTAFCSALGSTSVTMLSLLGDERCQLERYEKHRRHLHLNISRALRELRLLRQPLKKGQEPLPPSPFSNENFAAQGDRLAAYMRQLDEEQAELDRLFGPRDQDDDDDDATTDEADAEEPDADQPNADASEAPTIDINAGEAESTDVATNANCKNEPTEAEPAATPATAKPCDPPAEQVAQPLVDPPTKNDLLNTLIDHLHLAQLDEPGGGRSK